MGELQIKQVKKDPFAKKRVWTPEQLEQTLIESDYDTSKSFEYFIDEETGQLAIGEERIPVQNKYADVLANAYLDKDDLVKVRRHLKVIQKLHYLMRRLAKHGKTKTVFIKTPVVSEEEQKVFVWNVKSERLELHEITKGVFLYEERTIPVNYFDLRSSIQFFMEKAVDICHTSKALDGTGVKLIKSLALPDRAGDIMYSRPTEEQSKSNVDRIQDLADQLSGSGGY